MADNTLNDILSGFKLGFGNEFYTEKTDKLITDNLKYGAGIRPYQKEAFGRFSFYLNEYNARPKGEPIQLLFHMATGSGKTLIMAGLIIYLYNKGYRNFLFFVNSTNIINKTINNFFNPGSTKYLFTNEISINGKQIRIKEVQNFQSVNSDDINIVFSTIQGLHIGLNNPRENSVTYEDFEDKKIVMISDEAHHINVDTKKKDKLTQDELLEVISWESTVNRIFKSNNENLLLEFTATSDLLDPNIAAKYKDKLIFDYPLKQFRIDGYSKEVKLLQADMDTFQRAFQGVILSQYRRKIFEKNKLRIKPVILFKSKTINESEEFYKLFIENIKKLRPKDLKYISDNAIKFDSKQISLDFGKSDAIISKAFEYFKTNEISFENLIEEIKIDFAEEKCISVNSKDESEAKQIAINNLEDESNEYRAVFAVDKLNEGWDVLNLFDIVRLYETRDSGKNKIGKTTMSEAQLIGRGARYCPFQLNPEQELYKRKYDLDAENEMKVCEELYYHCVHNVKFISELNKALEEIGIKPKSQITKDLKLKKTFQESDFFESAFLYLNKRYKYDGSDIFSIDSYSLPHEYKFRLRSGLTEISEIYETPDSNSKKIKIEKKVFSLAELGIGIIRKAIDKLDFYQFNNLKKNFFYNLESITQFIESDDYLGRIKNIIIEGPKEALENLSKEDKLRYAIEVLIIVEESLKSRKIEYKGSKEFEQFLLKDEISKDKKLNYSIDSSSNGETGKSMIDPNETNLYLDISKKDWFVYEDCFGTDEEKHFIHFIDKVYSKLSEKYDEVYLVRNERFFKLYDFNDGQAVEPDFVLYLVNKNKGKSIYYQIFIEPKGNQFKDSDGKFLNSKEGWKESFLSSIKKEHKLKKLWKDREYIIWGLPFYNKILENKFENDFEEFV